MSHNVENFLIMLIDLWDLGTHHTYHITHHAIKNNHKQYVCLFNSYIIYIYLYIFFYDLNFISMHIMWKTLKEIKLENVPYHHDPPYNISTFLLSCTLIPNLNPFILLNSFWPYIIYPIKNRACPAAASRLCWILDL